MTDEQQKALVEETKKQLIASAKSVQDFEKITELPESGSVTLPVVQPDGSTKTFVVGNKHIYHAVFTVKTWAVHGSALSPQITNNDGLGLIFEVKDGDDEKNALNFDTSSETLTLNNVS